MNEAFVKKISFPILLPTIREKSAWINMTELKENYSNPDTG